MDEMERKRLIRLALKISYYRKIVEMSAEQLAENSDLSVSTIRQLESPTKPKPVSLKSLWRISDALGIHITKLLLDD